MWCHVVCSHASLRAGWPGPIGSVVAAVQRPDWDFSSTHRTTPCSGGQTYRPTTSRTLAMSLDRGELEGLRPVRLEPEDPPDTLHGRHRQAAGVRHAGTPMDGVLRATLQCPHDYGFDAGILNRTRCPERARRAAVHAPLHKTPPPTVGPSRPSLAATSLF